MESFLGDDFGDVRIHADPAAGHAAAELEADAFTVGRDVFFATGKAAFDTPEGMSLLSHELTHVRQSRERGPSRREPGRLREVAEEREAAASERVVRRHLRGDGPPRRRWKSPAMDLPDLGPGAGYALRAKELRGGAGQLTTTPGATPPGVARAPAARAAEPAPQPTEVAAASSDAEPPSARERESLDLNALASQVYELIMHRLTLERERIGYR
jgi:hypothetical protein